MPVFFSHRPRPSAARSNTGAPAAIDRQRFALVAAALGPARAAAVRDLFAEEASARPAAIRAALGANDLAAAASDALRLRGAAWALGAQRIANAADALAQALQPGAASASDLVHALHTLESACAATLPLLTALPLAPAAGSAPDAAFAAL